MSFSFILLSLGSMSHVDFKKWSCRHVHLKGQVPHNSLVDSPMDSQTHVHALSSSLLLLKLSIREILRAPSRLHCSPTLTTVRVSEQDSVDVVSARPRSCPHTWSSLGGLCQHPQSSPTTTCSNPRQLTHTDITHIPSRLNPSPSYTSPQFPPRPPPQSRPSYLLASCSRPSVSASPRRLPGVSTCGELLTCKHVRGAAVTGAALSDWLKLAGWVLSNRWVVFTQVFTGKRRLPTGSGPSS